MRRFFDRLTIAGALAAVIAAAAHAQQGATVNPLTAGQIPGTATNDSPVAGNVGESISSTIASGSAVSLTTTTSANLTSISLTAGDWDVWCSAVFNGAATTVLQYVEAGINSTSATLPNVLGDAEIGMGFPASFTPFSNLAGFTVTVGPTVIKLASTTTEFCVANSAFTTSTLSVYGKLQARRRR